MHVKALSFKEEAICEHELEAALSIIIQMDWDKVGNCSVVRQINILDTIWNHGHCVLQTKEEI